MVAQIVSLFQRSEPRIRDWSQQEIAEFYRVESALMRAGVQLDTDRGLSDEGDPWFVFCRADTGEVFIHFARIDSVYVVDGAAFERPARGRDFNALVRELIAQYPLAKVKQSSGSNVFVHPAALLIALVGAAFFHSNEAKASEPGDRPADTRRSLIVTTSTASATVTAPQWSVEADVGLFSAIILSAVLALREEGLLGAGSDEPLLGAWTAPEAALEALTAVAFQPVAAVVGGAVAEALRTFTQLSDGNVATAEFSQELAFDEAAPALIGPGPAIEGDSDATWLDDFIGSQLASAEARVLASTKAPVIVATESLAVAASTGWIDIIMKALPQVDRLPTYVLELIARGEQLEPGDEVIVTAPPPEPGLVTPPVVGGLPALPGQVPVEASPPTPALPLPLPIFGLPAGDKGIAAILEHFMRHVQDAGMMVQGSQLVVYDPDIFDPNTPNVDFESVTFNFQDGSTLSLIGTADEIHHILYG